MTYLKPQPIRVLIADDETLLRDAISQLLSLQSGLQVVAAVSDGLQAVRFIQEHEVDIAVLDLQMPHLDGIATVRTLTNEHPNIRCIIVTSHSKPAYLKEALAAGVYGYLPKTISGQHLADVIRQVSAGSRYVDPQLAAETIAAGANPLTEREIELLQLAGTGEPIDALARKAFLSAGTVRNYLSSAMQKLQVNNRHEAVARAREQGWID